MEENKKRENPFKIITENWNRSQFPGKIDPNTFTPYPKNPILAKFFMNIGRAEALGFGVRNLYKYVKVYYNGEPELREGDVFKLFVPMVSNTEHHSLTERQNKILDSIRNQPDIQIDKIGGIFELSRSTVNREIQEIKKTVPIKFDKKSMRWICPE